MSVKRSLLLLASTVSTLLLLPTDAAPTTTFYQALFDPQEKHVRHGVTPHRLIEETTSFCRSTRARLNADSLRNHYDVWGSPASSVLKTQTEDPTHFTEKFCDFWSSSESQTFLSALQSYPHFSSPSSTLRYDLGVLNIGLLHLWTLDRGCTHLKDKIESTKCRAGNILADNAMRYSKVSMEFTLQRDVYLRKLFTDVYGIQFSKGDLNKLQAGSKSSVLVAPRSSSQVVSSPSSASSKEDTPKKFRFPNPPRVITILRSAVKPYAPKGTAPALERSVSASGSSESESLPSQPPGLEKKASVTMANMDAQDQQVDSRPRVVVVERKSRGSPPPGFEHVKPVETHPTRVVTVARKPSKSPPSGSEKKSSGRYETVVVQRKSKSSASSKTDLSSKGSSSSSQSDAHSDNVSAAATSRTNSPAPTKEEEPAGLGFAKAAIARHLGFNLRRNSGSLKPSVSRSSVSRSLSGQEDKGAKSDTEDGESVGSVNEDEREETQDQSEDREDARSASPHMNANRWSALYSQRLWAPDSELDSLKQTKVQPNEWNHTPEPVVVHYKPSPLEQALVSPFSELSTQPLFPNSFSAENSMVKGGSPSWSRREDEDPHLPDTLYDRKELLYLSGDELERALPAHLYDITPEMSPPASPRAEGPQRHQPGNVEFQQPYHGSADFSEPFSPSHGSQPMNIGPSGIHHYGRLPILTVYGSSPRPPIPTVYGSSPRPMFSPFQAYGSGHPSFLSTSPSQSSFKSTDSVKSKSKLNPFAQSFMPVSPAPPSDSDQLVAEDSLPVEDEQYLEEQEKLELKERKKAKKKNWKKKKNKSELE